MKHLINAYAHSHHVDYEIFEIEEDDTRSMIIKGSVKWDGCSNWDMSPMKDDEVIGDFVMLHGCNRTDLIAIGEILAKCWDATQYLCPNWDNGIIKPRTIQELAKDFGNSDFHPNPIIGADYAKPPQDDVTLYPNITDNIVSSDHTRNDAVDDMATTLNEPEPSTDSFIMAINHPEVFKDIPWPADEEYQWWAVDKSGYAGFHKSKPLQASDYWSLGGVFCKIIQDTRFAHSHLAKDLWDQTLTERPNVLRDNPPSTTHSPLHELQADLEWPCESNYVWWAIDKDGTTSFFDYNEEPQNTGAAWYGSFDSESLDPIVTKNHLPEEEVADFWKQSLTKRPEEEVDDLIFDPETFDLSKATSLEGEKTYEEHIAEADNDHEALKELQKIVSGLKWDEPEAKFWAMDEDGWGFYHQEQPENPNSQWLGSTLDHDGRMDADQAKLVWRQSLTKLPEAPTLKEIVEEAIETPTDAVQLAEAQEELKKIIADLSWGDIDDKAWAMDENGSGFYYTDDDLYIIDDSWHATKTDHGSAGLEGEMYLEPAKLIWMDSFTKRPETSEKSDV